MLALEPSFLEIDFTCTSVRVLARDLLCRILYKLTIRMESQLVEVTRGERGNATPYTQLPPIRPPANDERARPWFCLYVFVVVKG